MSGLKELWLTNNDIQALPPQIKELKQLRTLGVGRNRISRCEQQQGDSLFRVQTCTWLRFCFDSRQELTSNLNLSPLGTKVLPNPNPDPNPNPKASSRLRLRKGESERHADGTSFTVRSPHVLNQLSGKRRSVFLRASQSFWRFRQGNQVLVLFSW